MFPLIQIGAANPLSFKNCMQTEKKAKTTNFAEQLG